VQLATDFFVAKLEPMSVAGSVAGVGTSADGVVGGVVAIGWAVEVVVSK
jgi:hypothetical protein